MNALNKSSELWHTSVNRKARPVVEGEHDKSWNDHEASNLGPLLKIRGLNYELECFLILDGGLLANTQFICHTAVYFRIYNFLFKVYYTKYYKNWLYTVILDTINCK